MATKQAHKRLTKEYKAMVENPPPYITAHPSENNILEWHYLITGPTDTPYEGGQYHGTLMFTHEYPFKPPAIKMITPSGRFQPNTRLCLSMSDYHPDLWNPAWSVATILTGLLSFMTGDEDTTGSLRTSELTRKKFARASLGWNLQNERFIKNFSDLIEETEQKIKEWDAKDRAELEAKASKSTRAQQSKQEEEVDPNTLDPEDRIRYEQARDAVEGQSSKMVYYILAIAVAFGLFRFIN
ncbi:Ubiquitin-conjugating enzyme E2 [Wickerhamomyces ciferrii]|uniref:Ubiquitin-conjugating enzyme E2 6 n=1 Tax=Wickerhamomyces ciferrii (strain ATCC 14091 / BCRC 22168 / CBS 111 / JCM 3599 / NBRC 0793 / NRRL Y-1031 F-60-10) TaxID=1206466 RepID=K0KTT2_WICCF|nr:Ubiquitin-conjugating enzyme E2 [Wickerhamomyces ciferrii]CCH46591.1 Ubiquitin-conjugating enzyme E2 [Wickerhamomyces ciferrii]